MTIIFALIALGGVIWFIVSGLIICDWLTKRKYRVNYIFLRFFLPLYVHQYKIITTAETGKAGALYYHWIISINIVLMFGIAAIVTKFA